MAVDDRSVGLIKPKPTPEEEAREHTGIEVLQAMAKAEAPTGHGDSRLWKSYFPVSWL